MDQLSVVEQLDYDVLITGEGVGIAADHLFVLAKDRVGAKFDRVPLGEVDCDGPQSIRVAFTYGSLSKEFRPPDLPVALAALVEEILEPGVRARHPQRVLECLRSGYQGVYEHDCSGTKLQPFLITNDGHPIAGRFVRPSGAGCWALPDFVFDLVPWAVAAVREWRLLAPERFPGQPAWQESERWATGEELKLIAESAKLTTELDQLQHDYGARIREVEGRLTETRLVGDRSHRALLTGQGDELVRAVADALRSLGFEIEDMDAGGRVEKIEDLRVTDPGVPGWVALVEVKGYARGGARASDLQTIAKYQTLFAAEHGRPPDAAWYVVNHSLVEDPDLRRPALQGADEQLAVFASAGGLVIDSRALFDIRLDVELQALPEAKARELMRSSRGMFDYQRREPFLRSR